MPQIHPNIRVVRGRIPVLVSAPHVVPIRTNTESVKPREKRIKRLLHSLCKNGGAWGIFTESTGVLENWHEEVLAAYKKRVKDLIKKENIVLFLDLHGAQEDRPFILDYDFKLLDRHPLDPILEQMLIKNFASYFNAEQLSRGFFQSINGPGQNTLTYYVRKHFSIPAVQLEYNRSARLNDEHFQKLTDITHSLMLAYENSFTRLSQKKIELRD